MILLTAGRSTRTVKRLVDKRGIHFTWVSQQIRFKLADVLAYEKTRRANELAQMA